MPSQAVKALGRICSKLIQAVTRIQFTVARIEAYSQLGTTLCS